MAEAQHLGQARLLIEGGVAHPQGGVLRLLLDGEELPVAPHGQVLPGGQLLLGEAGLDVVVVIDDVQDAAALAGGDIRGGGVFLPALDALGALDVFQHGDPPSFRVRRSPADEKIEGRALRPPFGNEFFRVSKGALAPLVSAARRKESKSFSRRHVRREKYSSRSEVSPPKRRHPSGVPFHRRNAGTSLRRGKGEGRGGDAVPLSHYRLLRRPVASLNSLIISSSSAACLWTASQVPSVSYQRALSSSLVLPCCSTQV